MAEQGAGESSCSWVGPARGGLGFRLKGLACRSVVSRGAHVLSWRMVDLMTLSRRTGRSDLPCTGQMVAEALWVWSGGSEAGRPVVPLQGRAWSWGHGHRTGQGVGDLRSRPQEENLVGPSGARICRWSWGQRALTAAGSWGLRLGEISLGQGRVWKSWFLNKLLLPVPCCLSVSVCVCVRCLCVGPRVSLAGLTEPIWFANGKSTR